jgi:hypothetical protein
MSAECKYGCVGLGPATLTPQGDYIFGTWINDKCPVHGGDFAKYGPSATPDPAFDLHPTPAELRQERLDEFFRRLKSGEMRDIWESYRRKDWQHD